MFTLLCALLIGCTPQPQDTDRPDPTTTPTGTLPTGTTTTTDTSDTGTTTTGPTTTYDCALAWPATQGFANIASMPPSEDFDITADGYLVHVENGNLVKRSYNGQDQILISPNVTSNAAGTRVLKNGDVLVAAVDTGTLILVDAVTGQKETIWSANWPNGMDVDADDNVYVSDFADNGVVMRINVYQPDDREVLIDNIHRPNGIALSPDGLTLYVAANWDDRIVAIDKDPVTGNWGTPRLFKDSPGAAQSVTTDVCGTVYWEAGSDVYRQTADGTSGGQVADPAQGYFPNLRFGNDVGGFQRDHLYGLSSNSLYEFHVGVPGKKHISIQ